MLVVVFRRHLREGVAYEEYVEAWRAEKGYGVKARVLNATSLDDERGVLTVGFVGISTHALRLAERFLSHHDRSRHDRIEDVIDRPPLVSRYEIVAEQRLQNGDAVGVRPGSRDSMLRFGHASVSAEVAAREPFLVLAAVQRADRESRADAVDSPPAPPSTSPRTAVEVRARGVDDGNELLSVVFVKGARTVPEWAREWVESRAGPEPDAWAASYVARDEHDFQKDPIAVPIGSSSSILAW